MVIFKTERLDVKQLSVKDKEFFIELLSDPEIILPIPQVVYSTNEILEKFSQFLIYADDPNLNEKVVWGIYEKGSDELIGLCLYLTNDEDQRELAYRFRKKYWGRGYATEVTKDMITYCFEVLNIDLITADVNIDNKKSSKVLEKYLRPVKEFHNEQEKCINRRYVLKKEDFV